MSKESIRAIVIRWSVALGVFFAIVGPYVAWANKDKWDVNNPPGDIRDVSIDVSEGTWMSLDVSPDGKTIAFDLLGDIYLMPIEGGTAKAITKGLAWDIQPRFSPDGSKIAFTSDRGGGDNIWIMDADGSNLQQVTKESFRLLNNPTWSPDGRFIAARKHFTSRRSLGAGEIWLYHLGGGNGVQLNKKPNDQKDLGEPMFSPDGKYVYFSQDTTPGKTFQYSKDSNTEIYRIRRIDLSNGKIENVISGPGGAVRPTPSPDGKYMAFVRRIRARSALFLKDMESGRVWPIYQDLDMDMQETWAVHGVYPNMDWMPDSASVVFWAGGKIHRIDIKTQEVTEVPFRVRDKRQVIDAPRHKIVVAPDEFPALMIRDAEISPDGSQVVYEALGHIYIKSLAGGPPERLSEVTDHFEAFPSFSPDGKSVVYVAWDDEKLATIMKVDLASGATSPLTTEPGHYVDPRFAPDGSQVVFQKIRGGGLVNPEWSVEAGLFKVSSDGGAIERITKDGGEGPHFGTPADRVVYGHDRKDKHYLVSSNFEGAETRDLVVSDFAREFQLSPDGKWLAWVENYHVYVAPMSAVGKAIKVGPEAKAVPVTKVSRDGGQYLSWTADSTRLFYTLGPTLFEIKISEAAAAAADPDEEFKAPEKGINLGFAVKAEKPQGTLALVGARIVTMDKDLGVIENGTIVIKANRISAIGSAEDVNVPSETTVVDLVGKTIIPGLIDIHAHGGQGRAGIVPEQNWHNLATLALGVTTTHDPSHRSSHIFAAGEMQRAGLIVAPRIFSTGEILYGARHELTAYVETLDDARAHVRRLKAMGAISVKNYNQPRRNQRQQVVTAARQEKMMVVAEGGSLFHMDMTMIVDGNTGIEHSLPQGAIYEDVKQLWSKTNVGYTPTMVVGYGGIAGERYWYQHTEVWKHPILSQFVPPDVLNPRSVRRVMAPEEDYFAHKDNARIGKQLMDLGVYVNIGAHGQREGLASHWEMWMFAQGGMSPIEALMTATVNPAKYMGLFDDIGSLEKGKLADLVVLDADPLANIRNSDKIHLVMLNGRLYDPMTMNEVVTGERKSLPFYWKK